MVKACASSSHMQYAMMRAFMVVSLAALLMDATHPAFAQSSRAHKPGSVSIRTPDFDESVGWYQDKLGFRLIATQNFVSGRTAVLEKAGALIEMTEVDHVIAAPQEPHATGGLAVTPVPVISVIVSDVDEEVERLAKAGIDILQMPQDDLEGTYRTAQIKDNGRHRIELREPLDEAGGFNPTGR